MKHCLSKAMVDFFELSCVFKKQKVTILLKFYRTFSTQREIIFTLSLGYSTGSPFPCPAFPYISCQLTLDEPSRDLRNRMPTKFAAPQPKVEHLSSQKWTHLGTCPLAQLSYFHSTLAKSRTSEFWTSSIHGTLNILPKVQVLTAFDLFVDLGFQQPGLSTIDN